MLNPVEHEIFSAHKYLLAERVSFSGGFNKKTLRLLVIWDLLAGQISTSAELTMENVL